MRPGISLAGKRKAINSEVGGDVYLAVVYSTNGIFRRGQVLEKDAFSRGNEVSSGYWRAAWDYNGCSGCTANVAVGGRKCVTGRGGGGAGHWIINRATTTGVVPVLGPVLLNGAPRFVNGFEICSAELFMLVGVEPKIQNGLFFFTLEEYATAHVVRMAQIGRKSGYRTD